MIRYLMTVLIFALTASAHASVVYVMRSAPETTIKAAASSKEKLTKLLMHGQGHHLDLDKLWHGLDWILAKQCATAPCDILMGGRKIGPDLGYGPAHYYTPAEVKHLAKILTSISPEQLAASFDAKAMDEENVYPNDWQEWERGGDEPLEMLQDSFVQLRDFFQRSAKAGLSVAYVFY